MSNKVLEHIAKKHDSVREGVEKVMGGKVLKYEAKTILRHGIAQGEKQGLEQGIPQGEEKLSRLIEKLITDNRQQDVLKVTQDKEFRKKLYEEYSTR